MEVSKVSEEVTVTSSECEGQDRDTREVCLGLVVREQPVIVEGTFQWSRGAGTRQQREE